MLSEIPDEWAAAVERWSAQNEKHKREGAPDRNTEYHLYQTMLGAWPISAERLQAYMQKACREAREQTRWTDPNEAFESAVREFVEKILKDDEFLRDFEAFTTTTILPGRINSLSQTLLRMTSPGVPDIYQGTEIWDLSLVDPDNRRPVDYGVRRSLLANSKQLSPEEILSRMDEGLPKLWTVHQALLVRREHPASFGPGGSYVPLPVTGAAPERLIGFRRADDVIAVVQRLAARGREWGDTSVELPAGQWRNRLTGDVLPGGAAKAADLLARFPVALFIREAGPA